ncbi:MAG: hypothetical protein ACOH1O_14465 [Flavobacterium sp.]
MIRGSSAVSFSEKVEKLKRLVGANFSVIIFRKSAFQNTGGSSENYKVCAPFSTGNFNSKHLLESKIHFLET